VLSRLVSEVRKFHQHLGIHDPSDSVHNGSFTELLLVADYLHPCGLHPCGYNLATVIPYLEVDVVGLRTFDFIASTHQEPPDKGLYLDYGLAVAEKCVEALLVFDADLGDGLNFARKIQCLLVFWLVITTCCSHACDNKYIINLNKDSHCI